MSISDISNPISVRYNFFLVLCTAPGKYRIVDPEGSIKPHCCVDIVIRHISINPTCYHITDKFRIQMNEHNSRQLLGKKDLPVTLLPGKSSGISNSPASSQDNFKQFTAECSIQSALSNSDTTSAPLHLQSSTSNFLKQGNSKYYIVGMNLISFLI